MKMTCKIYGLESLRRTTKDQNAFMHLSASHLHLNVPVCVFSLQAVNSHHILSICMTASIKYLHDVTNVASLACDYSEVVHLDYFS